MVALHEELVQRMKTVADSDTNDDDDALSVVVFEPSMSDPDLGQVQLQRIEPDQLPVVRQPNAEKKPAVVTTPATGNGRPAGARGSPGSSAAVTTPATGDGRPAGARGSSAAVTTPAAGDGRPAGARGSSGQLSRSTSYQGQPTPRRGAQLILCINKYGERQGELKDPLGVACLSGGEIVVSEWGNKRLQVFDSNGRSLRLIAPGHVNIVTFFVLYVVLLRLNDNSL